MASDRELGMHCRITRRDQHHIELPTTPFDVMERKIREQLAAYPLPGRIRSLFDPEWPAEGSVPSTATCDAAAAAYTDQAIGQAWRAIREWQTSWPHDAAPYT